MSLNTKQMSAWVINISNRNVSLTDLNLTIRALTSVNLLDKKHYQYSIKQIQDSITSGSLFKKRDIIKIRQSAPTIIKKNMSVAINAQIPSRDRSIFTIKKENYEELNVTDEQYAELNAEMAEMDSQKILVTKEGI